MTDSRSFHAAPRRTPSPSSSAIFAPPITPIVLESSPLNIGGVRNLSSADTPRLSPFSKSPAVPDGPDATSDKCSRPRIEMGSATRRGALAESHGKENLNLSKGSSNTYEAEIGCAAIPTSECSKRKRGLWAADLGLQADEDRGNTKDEKSRKLSRCQKKENVKADKALKGRVTKASAGRSQSRVEATADCQPRPIAEKEKTKEDLGFRDLQIEEAITRRGDWTPPKDTEVATVDLTGSPLTCQFALRNSFGDLISCYGFDNAVMREEVVEHRGQEPTKKRRLELVERDKSASLPLSNEICDNTQLMKPQTKAPTKHLSTRTKTSARSRNATITSLTTAPYEVRDATMPGHLSSGQSEGRPAQRATSTKSRTAKSSKAKKGATKKAEDAPVFRVAPPIESMKSLDDQVLLFGTCSQLARDPSPSFAVPRKADTELQHSNSSDKVPSKLASNPRLSKISTSKGLWSASSRDLDDNLADIEVVDLESPSLAQVDQLSETCHTSGRTEAASVDTIKLPHRPASAEHIIRQEEGKRSALKSYSGDKQNAEQRPTPIPDPIATQTEAVDYAVDGPQMPHYRGFSTAELAQQVAAFGFKPIKSRDKAVSLLEKCWKSQNTDSGKHAAPSDITGTVTVNVSTEANTAEGAVSSTTCSSKSRKQTRDKRTQAKAASKSCKSNTKAAKEQQAKHSTDLISSFSAQVDLPSSVYEIADSTDEDGMPVSSNRREPAPDPPVIDAVNNQALGAAGRDTETVSGIGRQITLAVQKQPRMRAVKGTKQPTWYEKILMYDPICLEDLTVWLNTEGLGRIGEDSEVNPLTVREWCESKGICCTWRKTSR